MYFPGFILIGLAYCVIYWVRFPSILGTNANRTGLSFEVENHSTHCQTWLEFAATFYQGERISGYGDGVKVSVHSSVTRSVVAKPWNPS